MSKTLAIIQARQSSTRLPGKSLADVMGKPLVGRVVDRVKLASTLDGFVLAIPETVKNAELAAFATGMGWKVYRGSEDDVLGRYVGAALEFDADPIVRITADCPFLDPGVIDGVLRLYARGGFHYVSNNMARTFAHGMDVEVFSRAALIQADESSQDPYEREHVTLHMVRHPERYALANMSSPTNISGLRLTVDYWEDLDLARALYTFLSNRTFSTADVIDLIDHRQDLRELHARALRAAGVMPPSHVLETAH